MSSLLALGILHFSSDCGLTALLSLFRILYLLLTSHPRGHDVLGKGKAWPFPAYDPARS